MANDDKLKEAAAHHVIKPGQKEYQFTLPAREPYESKATIKQKDLLWRMGITDQNALDNLGKRQASAMIDQMKAYISSEMAAEGKSVGQSKSAGKWLFVILFVAITAIIGFILVSLRASYR